MSLSRKLKKFRSAMSSVKERFNANVMPRGWLLWIYGPSLATYLTLILVLVLVLSQSGCSTKQSPTVLRPIPPASTLVRPTALPPVSSSYGQPTQQPRTTTLAPDTTS